MILLSRIKKIVSLLYSGGTISHSVRLALTVLFLIIVNHSITIREITSLFQMFNPIALSTVFALGVAIILLQAWRWLLILSAYGMDTGFIKSLKALLWGNVLAFVTPGRAGELFRGIELYPSQKKLLMSATITDRLFSIAVIILFAVPVLVFQYVFLHKSPPVYFTILISIAVVIISTGLVTLRNPHVRKAISKRFVFAGRVLEQMLQQINITAVSAISCIIHIVLIIQTMVLFNLFGLDKLPGNANIAILSYAFMLCVPISIANIGIREYAFTLFASLVYLNSTGTVSVATASLGVSTLILVINIVFPAVAGLIWNIIPLQKRSISAVGNLVIDSHNLSNKRAKSNATG